MLSELFKRMQSLGLRNTISTLLLFTTTATRHLVNIPYEIASTMYKYDNLHHSENPSVLLGELVTIYHQSCKLYMYACCMSAYTAPHWHTVGQFLIVSIY